jgi:hypothetical protein
MNRGQMGKQVKYAAGGKAKTKAKTDARVRAEAKFRKENPELASRMDKASAHVKMNKSSTKKPKKYARGGQVCRGMGSASRGGKFGRNG